MEVYDRNTSPSRDLNTSNLSNTCISHLDNLKSANVLNCNVCNKVFATKSALQKHCAIHSGKRPFRCCICNKNFTQKCNLIVHFRKHSGVFPYQCPNCNKGFDRLKTYQKHQAQHHGVAHFSCEVCKKSFSRYKDLQSHQPLHTSVKKLHVCISCQKCFSSKANLKVHSRIHTNELPFECSYCHKRFRQNHILRRHILVHTGERPYHCTTCHKRFSSRSVLKSHTLVHLRPFTCSTCNTNFPNSNALKKHLLLHSGIYPFVCNVCNKGFISKHLLRKHEGIHSNDRPFACNVCEKRFKYKGNLTVHELVHSAFVHFVCEICGKDFVHKNNFKRHLKVHSGERPYVCSKCDARFTAKHSLNIHYLRHTNSAPSFTCEVCGNCFSARSTLNYHKLKHLSTGTNKNKPVLNKVNAAENSQGSDTTKPQSVDQKSPIQYLIAVKFTTDSASTQMSKPKPVQGLEARDAKVKLTCNKDPKSSGNATQEVPGVETNSVMQQFCKIAPKPIPSALPSPNELSINKLDNTSKTSVPPPAATKIGNTFVINTDARMPTIIPMGQMQFYECVTCKQIFKGKRTFQLHCSMHDEKRKFSCNICSQAFTAKSSLKRHLQRHSGQPSYCCDMCQKPFFQLGNLKIHQRKCSDKTAKCNEIKVSPASPNKDLKSSINISNGLELLHSEPSKLSTTKITDANEGAGKSPLKPKPNWTCNNCKKTFKLGILLKMHKCLPPSKTSTASEPMPFAHSKIQDIEQLKTESKDSSTSNEIPMAETTHNEDPVSSSKATKFTKVCHICNKIFSADKIFERHVTSHTSIKAYKCFCKKRFKNELNLQAHQLLHALEPKTS